MLWFTVLGLMLTFLIGAIGLYLLFSAPLHILGLKKY